MQTKLEKVFPINASADVTWRLLEDIKRVAGCMPGAEITEQVDANHYKGKVRVKLGPATAAFAGSVEVKSSDAAKRQIQLTGKGTDTKGSSAASMDLTAEVRAVDSAQCQLVGNADMTLTGKLASFGGRMINQVSDQILKQFGENFAALAQSASGSASAPTPAPARELNLLALIWNILMDFFRRLFGRRQKSDTPS
jgi:carbon monoxide dehydrogenase subunit G